MATKMKEKIFLSTYLGFLVSDFLGFYVQSSAIVVTACAGLVVMIAGSFAYYHRELKF
jgi:hypothetical protein